MRALARIPVAAAALLVGAGVAAAQGAPTPPPGPGATAPAGGGRVTQVTVAPGAKAPEPEPNTYEIYDTGGRGDPLVRRVGESSVPAVHTVAKGDTLWGLCERYFRDPWRWPKIWALNPGITNPHWIYPGNRVRLRAGGEVRQASAPVLPSYTKPQELPGTIYLKQRGFIEEEDLKYSAKIAGSREEKILLATHDQVYVRYPASKPLKVGERYAIYKAMSPVVHPHTKQTLGQMVEVFGEVEIQELSKANVARGTILRAVNPVERGYLVGKLTRVLQAVKPIPNTKTRVTGSVVAVLEQSHLIGAKQLVFIDRGRKFHVKPGYTFYVTRRGDSYRATMQFEERVRPEERKWPREFVASIVVVEVGWNHAVGYVNKAIKEIRLGDKVELLVTGAQVR